MEVLFGALGLLVILVLVSSFLSKKRNPAETQEDEVIIPDADCCGAHEVCESDLPANMNDTPIYYDDEELDQFKNRAQTSYQANEEEAFMDVFLTLKERDIHGWLKSLQIRSIELPLEVREQALIVLGELRDSAS